MELAGRTREVKRISLLLTPLVWVECIDGLKQRPESAVSCQGSRNSQGRYQYAGTRDNRKTLMHHGFSALLRSKVRLVRYILTTGYSGYSFTNGGVVWYTTYSTLDNFRAVSSSLCHTIQASKYNKLQYYVRIRSVLELKSYILYIQEVHDNQAALRILILDIYGRLRSHYSHLYIASYR